MLRQIQEKSDLLEKQYLTLLEKIKSNPEPTETDYPTLSSVEAYTRAVLQNLLELERIDLQYQQLNKQLDEYDKLWNNSYLFRLKQCSLNFLYWLKNGD